MRLRSVVYFLREGLRSCFKNRLMSAASISTCLISLFFLGAFSLIWLQVRVALKGMDRYLEVAVFLSPKAAKSDALALKEEVQEWEEVAAVNVVDPDAALGNLSRRLSSEVPLGEMLDENPLPYALRVTAAGADAVAPLVAKFQQKPEVDEAVFSQGLVERLRPMTTVIRWAGTAISGFLLVAAMVLIMNTIRLTIYARRKEVRIMQLVGATDWFIRWPFVVEGVLQGLAGSLLAAFLLAVFHRYVLQKVQAVTPFLLGPTPPDIVPELAMFVLVLGLLMGFTSSIFSVGKFLEEP